MVELKRLLLKLLKPSRPRYRPMPLTYRDKLYIELKVLGYWVNFGRYSAPGGMFYAKRYFLSFTKTMKFSFFEVHKFFVYERTVFRGPDVSHTEHWQFFRKAKLNPNKYKYLMREN